MQSSSASSSNAKQTGILLIGVILLSIALGSGAASFFVWRQGYTSTANPRAVLGGISFFANTALGDYSTVSVTAEIRRTVDPGVSTINLNMNFPTARPGLRWFVAASGAYAPDLHIPLLNYCTNASAHRTGRLITCRDGLLSGSNDVTYNFADHIGSLQGRAINRITDSLDGYLDSDSVIVSGILTGELAGAQTHGLVTRVIIPIRTLQPTQIGSDKYYAYPPIGATNIADYGTGRPIARIKGPISRAFFADVFTREPINYIAIRSVTVHIDSNPPAAQLTWATPPSARANELVWRSSDHGSGLIRFSLHDPFAADRLSKNSFLAGILATIAASALLSLAERLIDRRAEVRKRSAALIHD